LTYKILYRNIYILNIIILPLFLIIFGGVLLNNDLYIDNELQYRLHARKLSKIVFDDVEEKTYIDYFSENKVDIYQILLDANLTKMRNEKLKNMKS